MAPDRTGEEAPAPVLVTGAGGPAAVVVIRALRAAGHRVAAVDNDPLAVGLRLADVGVVVPRYGDPAYVDELCRAGDKVGARVLVSTLAEEVAVLAAAATALDDAGLAHWLPDPAAVRTCTDKWAFACFTRDHDLPAPATGLGGADGVPGPWVVKPRYGRGSRDVHLVDDEDGLAWALARVPEPVVQRRLAGREFTVDALVARDGRLAACVARWRLATRGGISVTGETFEHPPLRPVVTRLLAALGLQGPANVQGFVGPDGDVGLVEVNPRFSGGLSLSLAAGADLVCEYVRGVLGLPLDDSRLAARPGVRMLRYFDEVYEG